MPQPRAPVFRRGPDWWARLHELAEPGRQPPARKLIADADLEFKPAARGPRRRTEAERAALLARLRAAALESARAEAEAAAAERARGPMAWAALDAWLAEVAAQRLASTLASYRATADHYRAANPDHPLREAGADHARRLDARMAALGLADQTRHRVVGQVSMWLRWCAARGMLERAPALPRARAVHREPTVFPPGGLEAMEAALWRAEASDHPRVRSAARLGLRAHHLLSNTGMRAAEAAHLPLAGVDLAAGVIRLREVPELGWRPKNRRDTDVPISAALRAWLEADLPSRGPADRWYLDDGRGRPAYARGSSFTHQFARWRAQAGLPEDLRPLHGYRATVATRLLTDGVPAHVVQRLLNHRDLSTTLRYGNTSGYDLRAAVDRIMREP